MVSAAVLEGKTTVSVSGSVSAGSSSSNYVIKASPNDVANYARQGNDLVIEMKGGQTHTIRNFAQQGMDFNNLVFTQGDTNSLVNFSMAASPVGDGIVDALVTVQTIGAGISTGALLGILGATVAGGAAIAAAGDSKAAAAPESPTVPTDPVNPTNPSNPTNPANPTNPTDPINPTNPAEPVAAPVLVSVTDDVPRYTGVLASGSITNDARPLFAGTGLPMATVELRDASGAVLGSAMVNQNGNWSIELAGDLPEGNNDLILVQIHDGRESSSVDFALTVDTIVSSSASILAIEDDVAPVIGTILNGGVTNDTSPKLAGTLSAALGAGETVEVLRDGVLIGTASVTGTNWVYEDSGLAEGNYDYAVRVADTAGNLGTISTTYSITVDLTPPAMATIMQMSNDYGVPDDFQTYSNSTVISGLSEAGATVEILLDGVLWFTATANSSGVWESPTLDLSSMVPGDTVTVAVHSKDLAGNVSTQDAQTITKLAVPPASIIAAASLSASQGFIIQGDSANDRLGLSVASAGDVNGDGFDDLIVGAYYGDDGGTNAGEAYVIFGSASGFGSPDGAGRIVIDTTNLSSAQGFIIMGRTVEGGFGWSVSSAGDVNGDGIDDIIIGARFEDDGGTDSGAAYVLFGSTNGFGAPDGAGRMVIDTANLTAAQGFIIRGDSAQDELGKFVSSAGDVNGDGIDDLIIGAHGGDDGGSNAGEAYVIFGSTSGFGAPDSNGRMVIDTTTLTGAQGFIIQGAGSGDELGWSVSSAGDLNGDGIKDLIVGASSNGQGGAGAGAAYVIWGSSNGFGVQDGNGRMVIDLSNIASQGFTIIGHTGDGLGASVSSAGDLNGDGIDDIVVGANNANSNGEAYVLYGSTNRFSGANIIIDAPSLTPADGFVVRGKATSDYLGWSVSSAGDVNGDGIDDLIVGAFLADGTGFNTGEAYVIYGSTSGFGALDSSGRMAVDVANLTATQGFAIYGDNNNNLLGYSVSAAGDVNGDGIDDLIVGAYGGNDGGNFAGEAYVIYGSYGFTGRVAIGTSGADFLAGTSSADSLTGAGGADVLLGYGNDDMLIVSDVSFARIDGGDGYDTLILAGAGLHLDFTSMASDVVTDIEAIDITGTGANTLTISAQDVLDLSSTTDVLVVNGNSDDTVNAIGFSDTGSHQQIGSITYDVYVSGGATLWLDQQITNVVVT